jgi:hypothetical protein
MKPTLADRVKERMVAVGIKNAELAALSGVKPPTSFNWGSGKTKSIKGAPLLQAARALGVTPDWLATGLGEKFPPGSSGRSTSEISEVDAAKQHPSGESIASGATNINVNRKAPTAAHDVAAALMSLIVRVEPGRRDAVASLLSSLARNPTDSLLSEMLVQILEPATFTQPDQRTG